MLPPASPASTRARQSRTVSKAKRLRMLESERRLDKHGGAGESTHDMTRLVSIESRASAAAARQPRVGVLLVNLGTPDTADTRGVRVYLKQFLSDPRVIENQGLL